MTYKTMRRKGQFLTEGVTKGGVAKAVAPAEEFLDGCLKEGTDQGWTLHSMYRENADAPLAPRWHIFVWETND